MFVVRSLVKLVINNIPIILKLAFFLHLSLDRYWPFFGSFYFFGYHYAKDLIWKVIFQQWDFQPIYLLQIYLTHSLTLIDSFHYIHSLSNSSYFHILYHYKSVTLCAYSNFLVLYHYVSLTLSADSHSNNAIDRDSRATSWIIIIHLNKLRGLTMSRSYLLLYIRSFSNYNCLNDITNTKLHI